jgi:hypothetical protein
LARDPIRKPVSTFRAHAPYPPGDIERPVIPKPLRGVEGTLVRMPVEVCGTVEVEGRLTVVVRVPGNHERGEELRLS